VIPFWLFRSEDVSGLSGEGYVAEGVIFHDGRCAMSWLTVPSSIAIYESIEILEQIHGHSGRTVVILGDDCMKGGNGYG